ncbi:MAG: hypothetical protein ACWA6X_00835 [Bauldia sp.]
MKPGVNQRGRAQHGFEHFEAVSLESKRRVSLLTRCGTPAATALAGVLKSCHKNRRCGSLACPKCARKRRLRGAAASLAFLTNVPMSDLRFVTLICTGDEVAAGKLAAFDPTKLIARTRRQLDRAGIGAKSGAFLLGFVDGEWDEGWSVYQPHVHAIVHGISRRDFDTTSAGVEAVARKTKGLSGVTVGKRRVRAPVRYERIEHDLARLLLYLDKGFWPSVARAENPRTIPPHGKRRLPAPLEAELLQWMHALQPRDLRFFYGVKTVGGHLKPTMRVHTPKAGQQS